VINDVTVVVDGCSTNKNTATSKTTNSKSGHRFSSQEELRTRSTGGISFGSTTANGFVSPAANEGRLFSFHLGVLRVSNWIEYGHKSSSDEV
jgi:hypothetical protein